MSEDVLMMPKRILENSYDIYNELNKINSAMMRASGVLGAQMEEAPKIADIGPMLKPARVEEAAQAPKSVEKPISERHSRAAAIARAFGFSSKVLSAQRVEEKRVTATKKEAVRAPPIGLKSTAMPTPIATPQPLVITKLPSTSPGKIPNLKPLEQPVSTVTAVARKEELKKPEMKIAPTPITTKPIQPVLDQATVVTTPTTTVKSRVAETHIQVAKTVSDMGAYPVTKPEIFEEKGEAEKELVMASNNPVSNLLNMVKTKHSITIEEAAEALHVDRSLVETWAKLLNSNALLKIKYQLMGDTILEA